MNMTHAATANIPRKQKWLTGTALGSPDVAEVNATKTRSFELRVTGKLTSESCFFANDIIAGIDSGSSV